MSDDLNVIDVLKNAGWFEGRKIDTSIVEKHYKEYGFELFAKVLAFLEEFGMLNIVIDKPDNLGQKEERHHTNPLTVVGSYYRHGKFEDLEEDAEERLVPVGQCCNENLLLFVSETGKIYHGTGKLGDTTWKAWEALIKGEGSVSWITLQRERLNNKET